ncbi:YbjN domain-containing protein [Bordetella hinzii]|uniref:YbjN domain-containing protein n=1 Tax=Bordetella hinzii TaxID=103855 RepID=UPI001C02D8F8|nr:YbjN domain-containing protein [Bordetella hinzii]QWF39384.1 YbjN domain-containing protein [Bordetella hinzii]QWF43931.1 YbjN domain-containing protein [Bordetella hinzii]QWF48467.1 YbjN domain-containing protein [Bordetella hinzii]QWF53004.1 YbjN domain-containing protein [Bordetella hinzii]QWF57493.1 YbjN domain-containing protein [Bordetella hinzii]
MNQASLLQAIDAVRLQGLLQDMGYRVTLSEQAGQAQLLSAAQGIGFAVRLGNAAADTGEFVDYTLSCVLRVQTRLPAGLVESWNTSKRFARLALQADFLVMEMDVILAGGVSEDHLRATTELWDRLLQELVMFLRNFAQQAEAGQAAGESVAA